MNRQKTISIHAAKVGLFSLLVMISSTAIIGYFIYIYESTYLTNGEQHDFERYLSHQADVLKHDIGRAKNDLTYLASLLNHGGFPADDNLERHAQQRDNLKWQLDRFIENHPHYYRINVFAADGDVRFSAISSRAVTTFAIPPVLVYEKINHCFKVTKNVGADKVCITDVYTGNNAGKSDKAIVSLAEALVDGNGNIIGMVAIDMNLVTLLERLTAKQKNEKIATFIVNTDDNSLVPLRGRVEPYNETNEILKFQNEVISKFKGDKDVGQAEFSIELLNRAKVLYGYLKVNLTDGPEKQQLSIINAKPINGVSLDSSEFIGQLAMVALVVMVAISASLLYGYSNLRKRLRKLINYFKLYRPGCDNPLLEVGGCDDIVNLSVAINDMVQEVDKHKNLLHANENNFREFVENMGVLVWVAEVETLKIDYTT